MNRLFLLVMIIISCNCYAQVIDNFDDGDFTQFPLWTGDQNLFKVNSALQLQLNDNKEGLAYLSTANTMWEITEWRILIRIAFSPSANNNARYYLSSNNGNLFEPLQGYFIHFGESGSDDAIELFRQDGNEIFSVCRGTDGVISTSFEIRVRVLRYEDGMWRIYIDPSGGEDFVFETEAIDNTYHASSHLGIRCKYTVSNSTKMYFDDVYSGPEIIDNIPPELTSVLVENDSSLFLKFSESITKESAENKSNYVISTGIGNPESAKMDDIDGSMVELITGVSFQSGITYQIDVAGITDYSENQIIPVTMEFSYYEPQPYDILINEIMADPVPSVELPEYEYLELSNQTSMIVDLEGWNLLIGSSEKEFESVTIEPQGYLIVAKETAYDALKFFGDFYGFESFSLTNSGQTVELISDAGTTISKVSYTIDWYHDENKSEGGWSIELINPENICSGEENWSASVNDFGGTPGKENSVLDDVVLFPQIVMIHVTSDSSVELKYNQNMDDLSIGETTNYFVSEGIGNPVEIKLEQNDFSCAELIFNNRFETGKIYDLTLSSFISNCEQQGMPGDTIVKFGLPEKSDLYDIVINEILFNPWTDGEDYVELYNRSDKTIDISEIIIGSVKENPPNPSDTTLYIISNYQCLLLPQEYMVLTRSPMIVQDQYYTQNENAFLRVDPFPSYNNDKGHVIILSKDSTVIDTFSYNENMHFPLLNYTEGVSLERNNPDMNISNNTNWHSASEAVGFGTPGFINSQAVGETKNNDEIVIEPQIFSPDNDGFDDITHIRYNFNQPGNLISITVLNSDGFIIRKLARSEYVGITGSISWDGNRDDNTIASAGIYIFYIEVLDLSGNIYKYKKTGVLALQL